MTDPSRTFPFLLSEQAEQERLRYAIQAAQVGTWHLDISRQQIWWDARCQELYCLPGQDVITYQQWLERVHPQDRQRVDEAIRATYDPSTAGYYDVQFRTVNDSDGSSHWLHCQGQTYVDVLGAVYRLSGVVRDVTAQVRTQQQLEASKARFRSLVLNSPTPTVLFVGRELVVDTINGSMLQIWDKEVSVTGQPLAQVVPELMNASLLEQLQGVYDKVATDPSPPSKAQLVVDRSWQQAYYTFAFNPAYAQDGTIFGFIHTATDVTREVLALKQLQQSEVRFRSLIEEAPVATCLLVGRELHIEVANAAMVQLFGNDLSILRRPLAQVIPALNDHPLLAILQGIFDSGEPYAARGDRADVWGALLSATQYVDWTAKPLPNEAGEVYAILVMVTEVTQQVLAQQALQESEQRYRQLAEQLEHRVAERTEELLLANQDLQRSNDNLQQFAYVASHDLQEPLRKIQSFSTLLQQQYASQLAGTGVDMLNRMKKAGERMSMLIRDLLNYSRVATRQQRFDSVSLATILAGVLTTLDWQIEQTGAQIELDELPVVKGDETQLGQLFQNLVGNALKFVALGQRPQVTIRYAQCAQESLPAQVRPTHQVACYHQISVSDRGVGFDVKYLDRIFQVFQRLHGQHEFSGTGVGLAICQRVVENHGGSITATSVPGEGTTFLVYLPI